MATNTSWEKSSSWYHESQGSTGDYYHQKIVVPNSLKLLSLKSGDSLLDLACGDGIFAKSLPPGISYLGLDISPSLIAAARSQSSLSFKVADITKSLPVAPASFSHAALLLSLQNLEFPGPAITNAASALQPSGKLLIVLNHPCFRIPRQSLWGIDPQNKLEYRRINRYLSPLKIPITTHPGVPNSPITWSFHNPLSYYTHLLTSSGFVITGLEEWASDKESKGKAARMENRARSEFPLFLALLARKSP
jgi:SAM-dependent methyltransferase